MRAASQDMVMSADPAGRVVYTRASKTTVPTALVDGTELLWGAQRLGVWKVATGQWATAVETEHMQFVHSVIQLHRNGRAWSECREIEMKYRRGMFTRKYTSWSCPNSLAALVVLSAPAPKSAAATKPRKAVEAELDTAGGGGKKRTKGKVTFVHDADSQGVPICRNWNNNFPCFGRGAAKNGKGTACTMSHSCGVCLKKHRACDHH
jgi:hypothetical protein